MQVIKVEQNSPEWLELRKGKITGSKLGDVITKRGTGKKIGYYQLIADRIAIEDGYQDGMDRGHDLEQEALDLFSKMTGKKLYTEDVMLISDINPNIAVSPDCLIKVGKKFKEAVEVKCLSSARYLEVYFTQKIPSDYIEQVYQYFIVDEDLDTLYFVCYDPRILAKPMFWITVKREEVEPFLEYFVQQQLEILQDIEDKVTELTF